MRFDLNHTFGTNSHLVLGVVLQETLDATAGELITAVSAWICPILICAGAGASGASRNERPSRTMVQILEPTKRSAQLGFGSAIACTGVALRLRFQKPSVMMADSLASRPLRCATSEALRSSPSRQWPSLRCSFLCRQPLCQMTMRK
jgi:hypothetical protein